MRLPKSNVFYGWWVIAAGGIVGAMNSGFYYYGFGAFFTSIIDEFGWSRAALSGAFSIARFESGAAGPVAGMLIDKFGPRRIIAIGITMIGLGFVLISRINGLLMFYLIFILCLAVGNSFGTSLPAMAAVNNWFIRRRGMAIGVLMAVFGVGGALGVPLLGWLIATFGWRTAAVIVGLIFWTIGLPISRLIYHRPEERGALPDGIPASPAGDPGADTAATATPPHTEADFTPRQALATSAFWFLAIIFAIRHLISSAIAVHEAPFLVDRGYTLEQASALLGGTVLTSVIGRLFWGWVGDRWDRRWILALCHGLMALGVLIMTTISDTSTPERVAAFIMVFGTGYGGTVPVSIAMVADYFGRRSYATIQGTASTVTMFGDVSGPILAGYIFDVSQSYLVAFVSFAVVTLAGLPLCWMVHRPVLAAVSRGPGRAGPLSTSRGVDE
ncbi:MAG: MFS transporter [Chloroflexi bacterium]|nr:MFS transporter [Chloroflexota bacterium]